MNLSVVIPAYNEADNIKTTVEELLTVIGRISDIGDVKIVVVDDHSSDDTYRVITQMNDSRIKCLRLSKRSGSHIALRAGLMESKGDAVLFISADGQNDPSCIENMLNKWQKGPKIVWALRLNRNDDTWYTRIMSKMFYKVLFWLGGSDGSNIDLSRADFYLLDKSIVDAINVCPEKNTSLFGLIVWLGFDQDYIEYERRPRRFGKSKWNFRHRLRLAFDWIVGFSGLPLKLLSLAGFFVALSGFLYALYVIFNAFSGNPIGGWSSTMVVVLVLGGIQMIMLGVVGEYLWRNLDESRKRPLYFIEKKTFKNSD